MPEGDTIHRTAATLRAALAGEPVTAAESRARQVRDVGAARLAGHTVERVAAHGKHLLIWFAPAGLALHTHLGMDGAWHLYRPGERWRKPAARAVAVVEVAAWRAVCFDAPTCELLTAGQVATHATLAALGPDPLTDDAGGFDHAEARRRLDLRADWAIGEALLDQRVLAGVGNVFKSEVLFVCGVNPWTPVARLDSATRDALLATCERLLRANVAPEMVRRTTTAMPTASGAAAGPAVGSARLFVYGRAGRPCRRCATPVRVARQGEQARVTSWCPRCQPPEPERAAGRGRGTGAGPRRRVAG